jgi:DNA polymerase elongation subunit (family B)
MLNEIDIHNILFLDIETVPQQPAFDQLPEHMKMLWEKKSAYSRPADKSASDVYQRAAIYAEFGKIVCISAGIITSKKSHLMLRIKSFFGENESELLVKFAEMLNKLEKGKPIYLCAHNGKEFDFPFISRRMLIQGIKVPALLDYPGKKPWEVPHLDTMELWKFGDYKHYTSLDLLTTIFDIPSSKNDMDGSMVADVYWKDKDIERIARYCQNDVVAIAQLMCRYKGIEMISAENIEIIQD